MPDVGEYQRNKKRADELVAYAAPYRLNIITTLATVQTSGEYQLILTNPQTRVIEQMHIVREIVDLAEHPSAVLRGYIDQMKRTLAQKSPFRDEIDEKLIHDLWEYAKPFLLRVEKSNPSGALHTAVELILSHPDYGFTKRVVQVAAVDRGDVLNKCQWGINEMRNELGWTPESKKEEKVAQLVPFVLECPGHGGQMVKVKDDLNHDEYFVCLVPGCKKKARQKNRVQSGGTADPSIEFQRKIAETPIADTAFKDTITVNGVTVSGKLETHSPVVNSELQTAMQQVMGDLEMTAAQANYIESMEKSLGKYGYPRQRPSWDRR